MAAFTGPQRFFTVFLFSLLALAVVAQGQGDGGEEPCVPSNGWFGIGRVECDTPSSSSSTVEGGEGEGEGEGEPETWIDGRPLDGPWLMDSSTTQVWRDGELVTLAPSDLEGEEVTGFIPFRAATGIFTRTPNDGTLTPLNDYLKPAGLEEGFEDTRTWATADSYDGRGKYGFATKVVKWDDVALTGTSIGKGFSSNTWVYYPYDLDGDSEKVGTPEKEEGFPTVVFAYGGGDVQNGDYGCVRHENYMLHLVSHGFIVVCPPLDMTGESMAGAAIWLEQEKDNSESIFYKKVSGAYGAVGWSSGGSRAINAVAHPIGRKYFSAMASLAPCTIACSGSVFKGPPCIGDSDIPADFYIDPAKLANQCQTCFTNVGEALERVARGACPTNDWWVNVPHLYATGSRDTWSAPPGGVMRKFDRSPAPGVMVTRISGAVSYHPTGGSQFWTGETTAFFSLHLKGDLAAASYIWGTGPDSMSGDPANSVYHSPKDTEWSEIGSKVEDMQRMGEEEEEGVSSN